MEWTRGHVEGAWVDEHLTTFPRTVRDRQRGGGTELWTDLFVHQSRLTQGISHHSRFPSRYEQTLSNQT